MKLDPPLRLAVVQLDSIPQAFTYSDLWLPAEPLWSALEKDQRDDDKLAVCSIFEPHAASPSQRVSDLDDVVTEAVGGRIRGILAFLAQLGADVIVLPEYSIPVRCLDVLVEHSHGRAIVAGVGYIRNAEIAATLTAAGTRTDGSEIIERNVAVLVENGRVHLTTKGHPAKGERAASGTGTRVVEVTLKEQRVRLGIAVCKDFLIDAGSLGAGRPHIVCIPARTAKVEEFIDPPPRDFVRIFANDAGGGGSTIVAPFFKGGFTSVQRVHPAAAGVEAVTVVDFHGFPQVPTEMWGTANRLVCRCEVVAATDVRKTTILRKLQEVVGASEQAQHAAVLALKNDVSGRSALSDGPLRQTLEACRKLVNTGTNLRETLELATRYALVDGGGRPDEIRHRQAELVLGWLRQSTPRPTMAGHAEDRYRSLLRPDPRPQRPPPVPPQRQQRPSAEAGPSRSQPGAATTRPDPPPAGPPAAPLVVPVHQGRLLCLQSADDGSSYTAVACAVDIDTAIVVGPVTHAGSVRLYAPSHDRQLGGDIRWLRPDGAAAVLGLRQAAPDRAPLRWGRLVSPGTDVPCEVVTADLSRPRPEVRTVAAQVHGSADPGGRYWLNAELGPVPAGSPVFCGGRCIGFVSAGGDSVLPAATIVWQAWTAGVLRSWPVFDAIEFLDHEMPAPDDGFPDCDAPGLDALIEWAAGPGLAVDRLAGADAGRVLRQFMRRQRYAGWVVLELAAVDLPEQLPAILAVPNPVLVVVTPDDVDAAQVQRLRALPPRRPADPAIRVLLRA